MKTLKGVRVWNSLSRLSFHVAYDRDARQIALDRAAIDTGPVSADLSGTALVGTAFNNAKLMRTQFDGAMVGPIDILDARGRPTGRQQTTSFAGADLRGAHVSGIDLTRCNVEGALR